MNYSSPITMHNSQLMVKLYSKIGNLISINRYIACTLRKWSSNDRFSGDNDIFNGVTVHSSKIKCKKEFFIQTLEESLKHWSNDSKRCVWFKVHINDSVYVPLLAQKGFNFHHARDEYLMMYKWLPVDSEPNLPPASHTNLGVGALVLNKKNQMLAISEKNYEYPHWKLPGGYVEKGEDIVDAAVREVKEETGINSEFVSLITFRHTHNMMYGNSDIYMLMMMRSLTEDITVSEREIKQCKWMDIDEYTNHSHVHEWNKWIVKRALQFKENNLKLDLQKKTVKWAKFTREMNFLTLTTYN